MSSADLPVRRLPPERIAELRAAGVDTDAERARVQAVCGHPRGHQRHVGWGAVCDLCNAVLG